MLQQFLADIALDGNVSTGPVAFYVSTGSVPARSGALMTDHARREAITILLVNDALEANSRNREEAIYHLLDAAGTIIVDAYLKRGLCPADMTRHFAKYLIKQVLANVGGDE